MAYEYSYYSISTIPDPADPRLQTLAGNDIHTAILNTGNHWLRTFSCMPPDSVSKEILFFYDPKNNGMHFDIIEFM